MLVDMIPKHFALATAFAVALPAPATARPLAPLVAFGLPFKPAGPVALPATHPLYRRVAFDGVAGMPEKVGGFLTPITRPAELGEAVRTMLDRANMLSPDTPTAKVRLSVTWLDLTAPKRVSLSSEATATLRYSLTRTDTGATIFDREIRTYNRSTGGDAAERFKGNARLALATNVASAIRCLDQAAYGNAPAECALEPGFTFHAPTTPIMVFLPR